MRKIKIIVAAIMLSAITGCEKNDPQISGETEAKSIEIPVPEARFVALPSISQGKSADVTTSKSGKTNFAIFKAEYITAGEGEEMGNVVFFRNLGNRQLGADFVPSQSLDGTPDVSYYIDENRPSGDVSVEVSSAAIGRAMATWDNVTCSDLGMTQVPSDGRTTGFVSYIFGFGGSLDYVADVNHAGWLPGLFFDLLAPGGSEFILGVTFTIIFIDENGNEADEDNDGKTDVAFREIYYNDTFPWQDGATFDIETIALHEAGHGLSQAHFGTAFRTLSNGKIHFSPRAVMNAAYSGVQTQVRETDNAGHCSNWANWPNN